MSAPQRLYAVDPYNQGRWDCEDGKEPQSADKDYLAGYNRRYAELEAMTALSINEEERNYAINCHGG